MDVPDEVEPRAFMSRETLNTGDEAMVSKGIPIALASPILNASPLAKKEPKNTLITFNFKEGCDVHQVQGEIGKSIRSLIAHTIRARFNAALREEISRNVALASLMSDNLRAGIHICQISQKGIHNGQLYIWMEDTLLPFSTILSVMSTIWESLSLDPISISLLDTTRYEVMFCGGGYNFF